MQSKSYWLASSIFYSLFVAYLLSTITLICKLPLNSAIIPASVILVMTGLYIGREQILLSTKDVAQVTGWLITILVISGVVSAQFFDISYDGQGYQQEAIIQLIEGWNPFYETIGSDILPRKAIVAQINYFPKLFWFISTGIYQLTGLIEAAKATSIVVVAATFLLTWSTLQKVFETGRLTALVISLVVVLNPVVVGQLLTFYVDGHVYLLLTALLSSSLLISHSPREKSPIVLSLIIFVILVNTKFTAAVFATIIILPTLFLLLRTGRPRIENTKQLVPVMIILLSLSALVSFNPYASNLLNFGHVFHPVMGDHKEDNITDMITDSGTRDFEGKNRFIRFYKSMYGKTYNSMNGVSEQKIPLRIYRDEYHWIKGSDPRIGGFGPLFSGAFTLSLISLLFFLRKDHRPRNARVLAVTLLVLVASILIHPAFWWARYVPQLYLVPVVISIFLLTSRHKPQRIVSWLIIVILSGNSLLSVVANIDYNLVHAREIEQQLVELKNNTNKLFVHFADFRSNRMRLAEAGIEYMELTDNKAAMCDSRVYLAGSRAYVCFMRQQ